MGQALYRKYRSRDLTEIVGQDPIITALTNALKTGKISHAYLFTGPRGVGKTSVARILAHKINDIEYTSDQMPMDIIEIDAASNRRIDEIRDLREKVMIAPVSAKFKVYIIDEVHMLTREAFNALLKTLEEPPAHVIFILATTESHKLPETIVSRTQKYSFKLATSEEVAKLLKDISKKENIKIDQESLMLIAEHSGGSLRDAVSLLDQIRHSADTIDPEIIRQNLGLPSKQVVSDIVDSLSEKETDKVLRKLKEAYQSGINANLLSKQLLTEIKNRLTAGKLKIPQECALVLMEDLLNTSSSQQADVQLEISLIKCQLNGTEKSKLAQLTVDKHSMPPLTVSKPVKSHDIDSEIEANTNFGGNNVISKEVWQHALEDIKRSYSTLFGILKMASVSIQDNNLCLMFTHQFHLKRASDQKNKKILLKALDKFGVSDCSVSYEIKSFANNDYKVVVNESGDLNKVASIFGSAEVIE